MVLFSAAIYTIFEYDYVSYVGEPDICTWDINKNDIVRMCRFENTDIATAR